MLKIILLFSLLISLPGAARPVLRVYTYSAFSADWGPGPAIKKAFEARCDCELQYTTLEDGVSLLNRLRMEGKNSHADIAIGLDNNLIAAAEKTGLFAPAQVDTRHIHVPGGWHNKTFVPYDYGWFAFIYDQTKLKNPPQSLKALVESDRPLRVIYQDPRTSTPGLGLLLWMRKVYGERTDDAWQKLAKKTVTVTRSWSEAYGLFLKGESDMVLSYTSSPAYHLIAEKKTQYVAANFSEGHYLQVEVVGRLKASSQPALAQQFMQFVLDNPFQRAIPTGNWMYPTTRIALPEKFATLPIPATTLIFPADEVARQRSQWIASWQRAVSH